MGEMKDINQGDESKRDSDFDILMRQHGYRSRNKLAQRLAETFDANDINPDRVTDKKRAYLKIFEKMQSDSTCKFETAYKIALITGCSLKELAEVMFPNLRDAPQLDFRFLERKIDVQLGSNGSKTWRENLRVEILADGLNRLENVAQTRCGGAPIHGECETRGFKLVQTKRIEPTTTIVFDVMCDQPYNKGDVINLTLKRTCARVDEDDRWFVATRSRIPTDALSMRYTLPEQEEAYVAHFSEYRNLDSYEEGRSMKREELVWNEDFQGFVKIVESPILGHWYSIRCR
jgi:hypothetical protein